MTDLKTVKVFLVTYPITDIVEINKAIEDETHEHHAVAYATWLHQFMRHHETLQYKLAITYEAEGDDHEILNRAYETFNIGQNDLAQEYRAKGNRSLSVSDVVVIDGKAYLCASAGWDEIEFTNEVIA